MEVVDESYLFSPRPARDHYAFWGRLDVRHFGSDSFCTLRGLSQEWGDSVKRITSRHCGGVRERSPLTWWSTLKSTKGDTPKEGYRPCVGCLELVLGVLLALDVLGWRTSKERNNGEAPWIAQEGDTPKEEYRVSSMCWVACIDTWSTLSTWSVGMEDIQRKEWCQKKVCAVQVNYYLCLIGNWIDMLWKLFFDFWVLLSFSMSMIVCMHMCDFKCRIMTRNTRKQGWLKGKGKIIEEQERRGWC